MPSIIAIFVGQSVGFFGAFALVRLFGVFSPRLSWSVSEGGALSLFWFIPTLLLACLELFFRIWDKRPGPAGLGPLYAAFPAAMSGAAAIVLLGLASGLTKKADDATPSIFWGMAVLNFGLAAALWKFWPGYSARMGPF